MSIQTETKTRGKALDIRRLPQKVAVTAKFLAPTNHRGSRVKISIPRSQEFQGSPKHRIISYDHIFDSPLECAANYIYDLTGIAPVSIATVTNPDHAETLRYEWYAEDDMRDANQWMQINEALWPSDGN